MSLSDDLPNEVPIAIIQQDITDGVYCSPTKCAVALAVKRALPESVTVLVGFSDVDVVTSEGVTKVYDLPDRARRFVRANDAILAAQKLNVPPDTRLGQFIGPFEFVMTVSTRIFDGIPPRLELP